jgi:tetratricopeptide (TPR) repeat protein
MAIQQLQSHFQSAMNLLEQGSLEAATRAAELAVDDYWKFGSEEITRALPLYSMLRHATGCAGDVFESVNDLPAAFSSRLLSEAAQLHEVRDDEASWKMYVDVKNFLYGRGDAPSTFQDELLPSATAENEKIAGLIAQVSQLEKDGKPDLALETALQLANEYADRGCKRRAYGNFREVMRKAKRRGRTTIRIDALLDFGQFMSRLGKLDDANRALLLAAGIARKAREKERFAHAVAALGVVLMHAGKIESAMQRLKTADKMLNPWDLEADIVKEHLEAIAAKRPCDCPTALDGFQVPESSWE